MWRCHEGEFVFIRCIYIVLHEITVGLTVINSQLQIKVDENGNIQESKFKTFGCGSAIASSSVATEWVKGKHVDEVLAIKNTDIAAHLKLPPVKLHCSMLAEDAIRAAVNDWKEKKEKKEATAAA